MNFFDFEEVKKSLIHKNCKKCIYYRHYYWDENEGVYKKYCLLTNKEVSQYNICEYFKGKD